MVSTGKVVEEIIIEEVNATVNASNSTIGAPIDAPQQDIFMWLVTKISNLIMQMCFYALLFVGFSVTTVYFK